MRCMYHQRPPSDAPDSCASCVMIRIVDGRKCRHQDVESLQHVVEIGQNRSPNGNSQCAALRTIAWAFEHIGSKQRELTTHWARIGPVTQYPETYLFVSPEKNMYRSRVLKKILFDFENNFVDDDFKSWNAVARSAAQQFHVHWIR